MPTKDRIIRFHAALSGANMKSYKADMLSAYGVSSTKDLTNRQADELIDRLNAMQPQSKKEAPPQVRRWRSVVLELLQRLGVYSDNRDWSRVNAYLLDPRIAGKLLPAHDLNELKALATKLRAILKKSEAEKQEAQRLAINN